ncbi:MAG: right-handed parallel beta-helix repeat-containing protein [Planctomycetes bacterium]|nr:right-handed parallel beta-helix repeat-containing protein [Planctomycetota bacterium]
MNNSEPGFTAGATTDVTTLASHGVDVGDRNVARRSSVIAFAEATRVIVAGVVALCLYAPSAALAQDCNFNGIDDATDIAAGTSLDCDDNGVPDECEPNPLCLSACQKLALNEEFDAYVVGQDPTDWFDTDINSSNIENDALFDIKRLGADVVFGTDSTLVNIHSHYVGPDGANISSMTYTGRMRLSDDNGGVGVTFLSSINDQPTSTYEYMRLRRANYAPSARTFHLAPPNFNNLIGDIDSGVDPVVNTWYRFRIEVDTTGPQLHIQANVWEDSQPEPAGFQIDATDPSGLHPTSGTVGVWSMTAGSKYWDDLRVINKDSGVRCDDNNACTTGDACSSGVCIGDPIDCSSLNDVCEVGVCDTASGLCETVPASEGSLCDDLDFCTTDDACLDGICAGTQVDCSHLDDACAAGVCNPVDGTCETTSTNDGGACDDLDVCTPNDICVAGTCVASPAGCSGHNVPPECETVLFVDDSATNGFDDGSSWEDAYVNLQDALAEAAVNCGVIEIWVAQGTYKPDQGGGQTSGDRSAMFQLQDNLAIYGGFSGTETSLDQRAPETNLAVLSGDLSGDDAPVACTEDSPDCDFFGELCFEGSCIINDNTDENSGQIVAGSGTDNSAVLDGFMITAGRSSSGGGMFNNSGDPTVANCTFARNMAVSSGFILAVGGGMFNVDSNPMVTNCTFFGNSSGGNGGGMQNKSSNPILIDCTFVANTSGSHGGGMYNDSSSPALDRCVFRENEAVIGGGMSNALNSDPLVTHCTFIANTSAGNGGGIYNSGSNPILTGCAFFGNSTGGGGGGVANFASSPPMTNCLLSGNVAGSGGGIFFNGEVTGDEPRPLIINCTFSDNLASNGGGIHFFPGSAPFVYNSILWGNVPNQISPSGVISAYSIIQGAPPTNEVIDADPLFVDSNGKDDIVGTDDDDLRLLPRSPAIDAGFSGIVPVGIITDLDSHPRFVDDPSTLDTGVGTFPIVDMGAFEFRLGDCDANGIVDLDDFDTKACLVGPDAGLNAGCACVDLDSDGDVDLDDFALFQLGFSP